MGLQFSQLPTLLSFSYPFLVCALQLSGCKLAAEEASPAAAVCDIRKKMIQIPRIIFFVIEMFHSIKKLCPLITLIICKLHKGCCSFQIELSIICIQFYGIWIFLQNKIKIWLILAMFHNLINICLHNMMAKIITPPLSSSFSLS